MLFYFSVGTKWHKRRKILTPAFHFSMLKQFVDVFIKEGNYMTQSLKDNKKLIVNDLMSFVSQHTLNAICGTYFFFKEIFRDKC